MEEQSSHEKRRQQKTEASQALRDSVCVYMYVCVCREREREMEEQKGGKEKGNERGEKQEKSFLQSAIFPLTLLIE
jgi:hypothetical protein